jgi:tape measure domain-containing protein
MAEASLIIKLKDLASDGLAKLGSAADKLADNLNKSKFIWGAIATGITAVGTAAIIASGKMEQWRVAFSTMLGGADRADALLNKIRDFAAKTPFDLPQVVTGAKNLLAFGVEANDIIPTLKMLGDVSAGLGVPMERLILNFGQVKAQTKLTGRELRDFAVAGVPLLAVLAEQLGKTEEQILEMVSAGKIGFPEVKAAFISMTEEGGRFANLMTEQSKTLFGQFSNLKDSVFNLAVSFGNVLLPFAKSVISALSSMVTWLNNLSPSTKVVITIISVFTAGIAALFAGLGGLVAIAPAVLAAFGVMFSPITLIAAGILGIVAAIAVVTMNFMGFRDFLVELFTGILESVTIFAQAFYMLLSGKFTEAFNTAKTGLANLKTTAGKTFGDLVSNAKTKFGELVDSLKLTNSTIAEEEKVNYDAMLKRLHDHYDKETEAKNKQAELDDEYNKRKAQNFADTMSFISSSALAENKKLVAITKAAAIASAYMSTYSAATRALEIPPPWVGMALAGTVIAAGLANVAKISGIRMAEGGIVMPRPGGTLATIGEAGSPEAVIPLDDDRAGGMLGGIGNAEIHIHAGTIIADRMSVREFATLIDRELYNLERNGLSVRG